MKIKANSEFRIPNSGRGLRASKRSEDGMATLVLLLLMFIMLMLVTAESAALFHLHREVRLLEQQQLKRLDASQTNSVAVIKPETK